MDRLEVDAGALALTGEIADESVISLGVLVELHPGISRSMHEVALESALRHWKREVGAVTRGAPPQWLGASYAWLAGWTVQPFGRAPLHKLSVAYRHAETEEKEQTA